ncbi:MAG: N-acetylmuramic acid 6-phosphate etherase [Spirochaetes bacterium]|nr:N-acetylmuramic acid 6-phosphate etherase [Spirochaetota bacterium]
MNIPEDPLDTYTTEQPNLLSENIDSMDALGIVKVMNQEDRKVALAVGEVLPQIAALIEDIVAGFRKGGRLIYIGAGTSGRLGVLDASECPPTFGTPLGMVQGLIAGGKEALTRSIENAEDREEDGIRDLQGIDFGDKDVLVGITASGQAPYVLAALSYARDLGAVTGAISCNRNSKTFQVAKHKIYLDVGPEIIAGSTRLKAGTAQKMVLNMLTTASMILLGKVYKNLMIDLTPVNRKLVERSYRLIQRVTGCSRETAQAAFEASGKKPKTAIVMVSAGVEREQAEFLLQQAGGNVRRAIALKASAQSL